jgi:hypothetical protein
MNNKKNEFLTLIDRVDNLLNEGRHQAAIDLINHSKQTTPAVENARGVCLMRLGKFPEAVSVLSEIVFLKGGVVAPPGTPIIHLTNLAVAMLKINNVSGALSILRQIPDKDKDHPSAVKIDSALARWKRSLNLFHKLQLAMGLNANKSVKIDFVPGDLK